MGQLGISRGAALYVGALIGPGLLLVPALAVQAAGAASIVAWGALLVLSAPLAITFAALGVVTRSQAVSPPTSAKDSGRTRPRSRAAGSSRPWCSARLPFP